MRSAPSKKPINAGHVLAAERLLYATQTEYGDAAVGRVSNKVALVTGGASGIGAAAVQRLAQEGAFVFVSDIDAEAGQSLADSVSNAVFIAHDVQSEGSWRSAIDAISQAHGRLDILFNNAGVVRFGSVDECSLEDYRFINSVMSEGTFLGCKTALPLMSRKPGGSIINMGSIAGIKGIAAVSAYSAAKGAVLALTRNVAARGRELEHQVRCNAIIAGSILTPMTIRALQEMSPGSASFEELEGHGQGQPADVANLVLFLASDDSSHMTGASVTIDNGETA